MILMACPKRKSATKARPFWRCPPPDVMPEVAVGFTSKASQDLPGCQVPGALPALALSHRGIIAHRVVPCIALQWHGMTSRDMTRRDATRRDVTLRALDNFTWCIATGRSAFDHTRHIPSHSIWTETELTTPLLRTCFEAMFKQTGLFSRYLYIRNSLWCIAKGRSAFDHDGI